MQINTTFTKYIYIILLKESVKSLIKNYKWFLVMVTSVLILVTLLCCEMTALNIH